MSRFAKTSCSQCGGEFGPGDEGYSHCEDHEPPFDYAHTIRCGSCDGHGTFGEHGCTDCLGTGLSPVAMSGGIEQALNDAYAEGRSDERGELTQAAADVLAERQRQTDAEGWTPEHDDAHNDDSLSLAAASYAICRGPAMLNPPTFWPWGREAWKPKDERCNLVRAGALILAEIERFDRAAIAKAEGRT